MTWLSTFLRKLFSIRDQQENDVVKPFLDHLEDLRMTLFKMAATLAIGMAAAFSFHRRLMTLVRKPLDDAGLKLISTHLIEGVMITVKLSFYAGIILSFPILLYFAAEFILPALTRKEKRLLIPGVTVGFLLFGSGAVISYDFILPRTIKWLASYSEGDLGLGLLLQAGPYFSFVTQLTIACGLLCELPIVVVGLSMAGIVTYQILSRTRAYAMVCIGILVAILRPLRTPSCSSRWRRR